MGIAPVGVFSQAGEKSKIRREERTTVQGPLLVAIEYVRKMQKGIALVCLNVTRSWREWQEREFVARIILVTLVYQVTRGDARSPHGGTVRH